MLTAYCTLLQIMKLRMTAMQQHLINFLLQCKDLQVKNHSHLA